MLESATVVSDDVDVSEPLVAIAQIPMMTAKITTGIRIWSQSGSER
jgi:hypothetical protein